VFRVQRWITKLRPLGSLRGFPSGVQAQDVPWGSSEALRGKKLPPQRAGCDEWAGSIPAAPTINIAKFSVQSSALDNQTATSGESEGIPLRGSATGCGAGEQVHCL